jgi:hypothetical protein
MPVTPIPDRMRHLTIDRRGYPVPFMAFVDSDGTPHFAINDTIRQYEIERNDLCSICGTKLLRGRWFIGGPGAAFHPNGAYLDRPMHDECAHYALLVCPFIAAPKFAREIGPIKAAQIKDGIIMTDDVAQAGRPPVFVAVMAVSQKLIAGGQYIKPSRPYRKIEYWLRGQQLSEAEARPLVEANLAEIEP